MSNSSQSYPYERMERVGGGAYGDVYQGRHRVTRELVALKVIDWRRKKTLPPEVSLLKKLNDDNTRKFDNDNIVRLISYGRNAKRDKLQLVLEYVPTDLEIYIGNMRARGGLQPRIIRSFMHQLLSGIRFLHEKKILHRDLKPANILVDEKSRLKIADFGSAISYARRRKPLETLIVTLWYRPPDVLLGNGAYRTDIDIWSAGCIMAELFSGKPLFCPQGETQLNCIFRIMGTPTERTWRGLSDLPWYQDFKAKQLWKQHSAKSLKEIVPRISNEAADLLQKMLQLRPQDRISAADALAHRWFRAIGKRGRWSRN